ncbi:hypothetical protein GF362_00415 [Candidatus Dojkabacteria bacterium]|nr:hypothetical protein [Candidatus Dojkabacteria bacterium]
MEKKQTSGEIQKIFKLKQRIKIGADWFYWIAGLSVVNSAIFVFGGGVRFIVGLGVTQLAESMLSPIGNIGLIISFGFTLITAIVFIVIGIFARQNSIWAFLFGLVLYLIDTFIFIVFTDIFAILFHIFALVQIFMGMNACKNLRDLNNNH